MHLKIILKTTIKTKEFSFKLLAYLNHLPMFPILRLDERKLKKVFKRFKIKCSTKVFLFYEN